MTWTPNIYAYVGGNPIAGVDPSGLATVIFWGMGTMSNPAGHAALAFTGQGVYSYGTPQPFGSSATAYLQKQASYRDTVAIVLNTTPQQESQMIASMNSVTGSKYSLLTNNCATAAKNALAAAGITAPLPEIPFLPVSVRDIGFAQPGATTYFIPEGGAVPGAMSQFNPGP